MWKLTETMGFQKLCETASKSPTNDPRDSPMGIIKEQLDRGYFDMYEQNLVEAWRKLPEAENIIANIKNIPFRDFFDTKHGKIAEFLASSGTSGIAGAYYLIPIKLYAELQTCAMEKDITAQISKAMLGPNDVSPGTTVKIDVVKDGQFKCQQFSPGGLMGTETLETVQASMDFTPVYGVNIRITNDLIEDALFDVMAMHVQEAGKAIGEKAADLAITVMYTASSGDGTINGGVTGNADETKFDGGGTYDYMDCYQQIVDDRFMPTTIIAPPHTFFHSVYSTAPIGAATYSEPWAYNIITNGLPTKILGCDVLWGNWPYLLSVGDAAGVVTEGAGTLMFDKNNAMITGRKRWMRIEKYSEPVKDLSGCTVTFRQAGTTIYKDAIAYLTETN